jgi:hypothetical protein
MIENAGNGFSKCSFFKTEGAFLYAWLEINTNLFRLA